MTDESLFVLDDALMPVARAGQTEAAPISEAHRRQKLRLFMRDETELQRREFHRFVSACLAGRHCPPSETFSGPDLPEGTRVRASDRDYIASRRGWRRVDLGPFVSAKPQKSQLYVGRKAKRDKFAGWTSMRALQARQAISTG